jgi:predicted deacetylase
MAAQYLIRLDDACPTMDHARWARLEGIFDALGICPMVAVVPANVDPELDRAPADPAFWDKVRGWQGKGWAIAMHGLEHDFHPVDRHTLLLPFYDRSEFAGLGVDAQAAKLAASWALFAEQGVEPGLWIAPAHCFDRNTLAALAQATPIRTISDGIAMAPYRQHGFNWIPQQLWALAPRRHGVWTLCLHPNTMTERDMAALEAQLQTPYYRSRVIGAQAVVFPSRGPRLVDRAYAAWFWRKGPLRRMVSAGLGWALRPLLQRRSAPGAA